MNHRTLAASLTFAFPLVLGGAGCGAPAMKVTGQAQPAAQAQVAAPTIADGLEVRLLWALPGEAARDGELEDGDASIVGYAGAGVALSGDFPASFAFEADEPPAEALVTRDGASWAQGMLLISTPAALDAIERLEAPAPDTQYGGARVGVMFIAEADAGAQAQLAVLGQRVGFNLMGGDAEALECYVESNRRHGEASATIRACQAECDDDECSDACIVDTADAASADISALECPNPYLALRTLPLDSPVQVDVGTFGDDVVSDYDGDGIPDVIDALDDSEF